jgi:hypothetical protein
MNASLDDVAREFVALFEQFGVPYALMGGLAVRLDALQLQYESNVLRD